MLTARVFVIVSGFVGAKESVGTTTSGQVDLQGGNSRPPWKSLPGAAASMVLGPYNITLQTLAQMRRRHGAARNL